MAQSNISNLPKHRLIEQDLLTQIKSGKLVVGQQVATGDEVSRKYGVSVPTADKAIVNLADKGYLERTRGRGTFVKDWQLAEDNNAQAHSIVVVCTGGLLDFYARFMNEACREAEDNGYSLIYSAMNDEAQCSVPLAIRKQHALGTLLVGRASEHQATALLKEDVPLVFVGNHRDTFGQPSICHDLQDGAYQVTKKLLELQRGPVWMVTQASIDVYYSQELQDGYQRAVFESANSVYNVHVSRRLDDEADYERLVQRMIATGQKHFPMMVSYTHVLRLMEHLQRNSVDFDRTSIVLIGRRRDDCLHLDRLMEWDVSLSQLACQAVRQIIAAAADGSPVVGKRYKLKLETVDDPIKPFKFSWE